MMSLPQCLVVISLMMLSCSLLWALIGVEVEAAILFIVGPRLTRDYVAKDVDIGPVRFSYNPYFSACFFSRNNIFSLTTNQQDFGLFFSKANGAIVVDVFLEYY